MRTVLIEIDEEDYDFILGFDPDRDRTANRAELVEVLTEIADIIEEGFVGIEDDDELEC